MRPIVLYEVARSSQPDHERQTGQARPARQPHPPTAKEPFYEEAAHWKRVVVTVTTLLVIAGTSLLL